MATYVPNNPYPHVITQGVDWNKMFLTGYSKNNVPDIYNWTATYVVFPDLDPGSAPVIALGTSPGMTITYADDTASTVTTGGITLNVTGVELNITTANGAQIKGSTTVVLDNTNNLAVGRTIAVWLSDGTIHIDTVVGVAGSTVTLGVGLSESILDEAVIKLYDERWAVTNVLLSINKSTNEAFESWGVGYYRFDLMDTFGHTQQFFAGTCCLERGYGHG